ncbi:hypothetical protein GQ56_0138595 [Burkholderia paludis]|nr:hypothetical protein GQ56_0138595 [Burkholderia paludis]
MIEAILEIWIRNVLINIPTILTNPILRNHVCDIYSIFVIYRHKLNHSEWRFLFTLEQLEITISRDGVFSSERNNKTAPPFSTIIYHMSYKG